jgi:hypothetical protein
MRGYDVSDTPTEEGAMLVHFARVADYFDESMHRVFVCRVCGAVVADWIPRVGQTGKDDALDLHVRWHAMIDEAIEHPLIVTEVDGTRFLHAVVDAIPVEGPADKCECGHKRYNHLSEEGRGSCSALFCECTRFTRI